MVVRQWAGASEIPAPALPAPPRQRGTGTLRSGQRELVRGFRAHAAQVAADIVTGVRKAVPDYAETLSGPFGKLAAGAVQSVLVHGIDALIDPDSPREDWAPVVRGLGKVEFTEGRPLDAVRDAFRVAARIARQRLWDYLRAHGASMDWPRYCADLLAARFDELYVPCAEGYAEAKAGSPDAVEHRRRQLLQLLVAEPGAEHRAIAQAARVARWPLPSSLTVVALAGGSRPAALPSAVLADLGEGFLAADSELDLGPLLSGARAAIGPAVAVTEGAASLRVARRALSLAERGMLPSRPVLDCAEHRLLLTLFADELLVEALIDQHLAPLSVLAEAQQDRMLVTLHEWLASRGRAAEVASRLQVHAQTVRYRMHKLEELLGPSLDDPQSRFELEVAVRARMLRSAT